MMDGESSTCQWLIAEYELAALFARARAGESDDEIFLSMLANSHNPFADLAEG